MDISTITNVFKLPKKAYFLISIILGILLFSNDDFLKRLSLLDFKEDYALWIGVGFLISIGMTFIETLEFLMKQCKIYQQKKEDVKRETAKIAALKDKLKNLDDYEKAILREFYIERKNTLELSYEDPVVKGLITKGVINLVVGYGHSTNLTGVIVTCSADEETSEYFKSFEFPEIKELPRPAWIASIQALQILESKMAQMMRNI